MNWPPIHPALVHLPIAFVLLSVMADFAGRFTKNASLRAVGFWSLIAALAGGLLTMAAGYLDMSRVSLADQTQELVAVHLKVGWALGLSIFLLTVWRWLLWHQRQVRLGGGYLAASLLVLGLTMFQGWFGGGMVYAYGAGVAPAGQGTEATVQAQKRLAVVGQWFGAAPEAVGGAGSAGGTEQGRGQAETNSNSPTPNPKETTHPQRP